MKKSDTIGKLAEALSKVQAEIKGAVKDSTNPFFKANYADLSSVWEACRTALTSNGLSVVQTTDEVEGGVVVETTLLHTSGEWIGGRLALRPTKSDPQGIGSAITYGRRYGLQAIVGICPEDDDGEGAMGRKPEKKSVAAEPHPSPQKAASTTNKDFKFLEVVTKEKKRIGEKDYYYILGQHGFTHANEITDRKAKEKVYADLKQISSLEG
ncbi:MAG: ERF family protein [Deltaproteobacteria bacterium]|nr:ERF family protein [Deltaproteobacteria bacterium]